MGGGSVKNSLIERNELARIAKEKREQPTTPQGAGRVLWGILPLIDRERAMMLAKMPRARASEPIENFTTAERLTICGALSRHAAAMSMVGMCMCVFVERAGTAEGFVH